ncbi:MAG: AraC family transcriptional regulator [Clostridia bacterium]|nr:AraC family transcriptional regulator [Clostridia bacterium]
MIRNLNRLSFSTYGRVLGERLAAHGFPTGDKWITRQQSIVGKTDAFYQCANADVYMDYESGMAVLLVSRSADSGDIEAFYLDKPVCVSRGIYYCVIPFDESCEIHLCMHRDAQVVSVPRQGNGSMSVLSANMNIRGIRTLFYQEKENGFFFKGEAHRQYELTYMDKGSMHSIVGGQEYILEPGEMMLYGLDQWHSQYAEEDGRVCFLTITFDMDCDYIDILLNQTLKVDSAGAALLNSILRESRQADVLSGDFICCQLMQFLLCMIRRAYRGEPGTPLPRPYSVNSENNIVDQALRYITENIYDKLTVAGVAKAVNVSPSYLSVLFSRHLKTKPSDYIRREKLEESKRLIKQGEMSFSQIADELRFSSVCHFSYLFKKWYGMTPSEFSRSIAPGELIQKNLRKAEEESHV